MSQSLPDVRDGLTRIERVVLWQLGELARELGDRPIPSAMLVGRVAEHVTVDPATLQQIVARLAGRGRPGAPRI